MTCAGCLKRWLAVAAVLLAAGCAAERDYRDGKELIEQGKTEEGLARLERATQEAPDDLKIRTYYFRQRDAQLNQLLIQADAARVGGDYDAAEALYRRVQKINADNPRAAAGLDAVAAGRRHRDMLSEAERLINKNDAEGAKARLHVILAEDPHYAGAKSLLRHIEEKEADERAIGPSLKSVLKRPITLEFRDASLNSVFEFISQAAKVNFMMDKDVRPDVKVNVFLKDVAIEDAINFVLATNQLAKRQLNDNTLLVYPNTPAKAKEYQPLVTRGFYIANSEVKQTERLIKTLVKTKDIFIDEKLNMLVMRDTPEAVHMAERLIALHDVTEPEVTLAVEVMEVSTNRLTNLGIRYPTQVSLSVAGAAGVPGKLTLPEFRNRNAGLVSMTVSDPLLIANLQAQDGENNLLANPRIRVKNREKAKILIGDKVPVFTTTAMATGFVSDTVTYLDVGLKLEVEPDILLEDEVSLKMGLEVSNIVNQVTSKNGTQAYQIGTRNASTVLRLKDGETQVLAGLINDNESDSADKIPGLGDLPIVGRLFSNHQHTKNKSEIILLVTPHIVRNINRPDATVSEFASGTEAAVGAPPLVIRPGNGGGPEVENSGAAQNGGAPAESAPATQTPPPAPSPSGASGQPSPMIPPQPIPLGGVSSPVPSSGAP